MLLLLFVVVVAQGPRFGFNPGSEAHPDKRNLEMKSITRGREVGKRLIRRRAEAMAGQDRGGIAAPPYHCRRRQGVSIPSAGRIDFNGASASSTAKAGSRFVGFSAFAKYNEGLRLPDSAPEAGSGGRVHGVGQVQEGAGEEVG
jgi:hypothetical protein